MVYKNSRRLIILPSKTFLAKLFSYLPLAGLAMFVLAGNVSSASSSDISSNYALGTVDTEATVQTLAAIESYTPYIEEDITSVALGLVNQDEGYLEKPVEPQTVISSEVAKMTTSAIEEAERSVKRDKTITYTVQAGDTLTGIGWKFGLKIASLKYTNNLLNVGAIKPGQALKIPASDISPQVIAKATSKKKLASSSRSVTSRERAEGGFEGNGGGYILPVQTKGVSRRLSRGHYGVDYRADAGTPVWAAANGRVVEVDHGWASGYGNSIVIDHGGGRTTRYAHLADVDVGVGQTVAQGQVIGSVGLTGWTTGFHLHWETRINGQPYDAGL